ncbi:hypothetical protein ACXHH8_004545 [Enterobacter roggenkampii]
MAQVLVYTKNIFLRIAIDALTKNTISINYFSNRVQFLACATVLEDAVLLIDATGNSSDCIRWLDLRLKRLGARRKVYYLVPESMLSNNFTAGLFLIGDLFHLKSLLFFTYEKSSINTRKSIYDEINFKLERLLSAQDYSLIRLFLSKKKECHHSLSKKEINRLYYIRRNKLNLNTSTEFKYLLLLLKNNDTAQMILDK